MDFNYTYVEGPGVSGGIGDVTHYYDWMYDCPTASDTKLASPGTISDGDAFENYWAAYGTQILADDCLSPAEEGSRRREPGVLTAPWPSAGGNEAGNSGTRQAGCRPPGSVA